MSNPRRIRNPDWWMDLFDSDETIDSPFDDESADEMVLEFEIRHIHETGTSHIKTWVAPIELDAQERKRAA